MNSKELRLRRLVNNLSSRDMGRALGISDSAYRLKERGAYGFTADQVLRVAQTLDLNLDDVNVIFFDQKLTKS